MDLKLPVFGYIKSVDFKKDKLEFTVIPSSKYIFSNKKGFVKLKKTSIGIKNKFKIKCKGGFNFNVENKQFVNKNDDLGKINGEEVKIYVKSKYDVIVIDTDKLTKSKKRKRKPEEFEPKYYKFNWLIDILPDSILDKYDVHRPYSVKTYKELLYGYIDGEGIQEKNVLKKIKKVLTSKQKSIIIHKCKDQNQFFILISIDITKFEQINMIKNVMLEFINIIHPLLLKKRNLSKFEKRIEFFINTFIEKKQLWNNITFLGSVVNAFKNEYNTIYKIKFHSTIEKHTLIFMNELNILIEYGDKLFSKIRFEPEGGLNYRYKPYLTLYRELVISSRLNYVIDQKVSNGVVKVHYLTKDVDNQDDIKKLIGVYEYVQKTFYEYVLRDLQSIWRNAVTEIILNDMEWVVHTLKGIYFQLIYTLMCLDKWFNFKHNDLHAENLMLNIIKDKGLLFNYNKNRFFLDTRVLVKIIDFDRASNSMPFEINFMKEKKERNLLYDVLTQFDNLHFDVNGESIYVKNVDHALIARRDLEVLHWGREGWSQFYNLVLTPKYKLSKINISPHDLKNNLEKILIENKLEFIGKKNISSFYIFVPDNIFGVYVMTPKFRFTEIEYKTHVKLDFYENIENPTWFGDLLQENGIPRQLATHLDFYYDKKIFESTDKRKYLGIRDYLIDQKKFPDYRKTMKKFIKDPFFKLFNDKEKQKSPTFYEELLLHDFFKQFRDPKMSVVKKDNEFTYFDLTQENVQYVFEKNLLNLTKICKFDEKPLKKKKKK